MWLLLLLWRASRLPLNCETLYVTLKRHFSQMICLLQPHPPATCVCVFFFLSRLSIQVFTLARPHPPTPILQPSPISVCTIQALQLTNLLFIAAQRPLCSSLCRACCPLSRSCSGSLRSSPAPTFSPRPFSPPPDCNNVSKCG